MSGDHAAPKPKLTSELLASFRDLAWSTSMPMTPGQALTLHAMAKLSVPSNKGKTDQERAERAVRRRMCDIAHLSRVSVRQIGRNLDWAEKNGWIKVVKKPGKGNAAYGEWILLRPDFMPVDTHTDEQIKDRERLARHHEERRAAEAEAAPTPVEAAPTPVGIGIHADTEAASTPVEAASTPVEAAPTPVPTRGPSPRSRENSGVPAPPAVGRFAPGQVPVSSGAPTGPSGSLADVRWVGTEHAPPVTSAEKTVAEEVPQPQDAHASALAGIPPWRWPTQHTARGPRPYKELWRDVAAGIPLRDQDEYDRYEEERVRQQAAVAPF